MPRKELHYSRFDTSVCPTGPDRCACTTDVPGESCECCGRTIPEPMGVEPMDANNGPGWSITGVAEDRGYMLWAPRPADGDRRGRTNWAASWERRGGYVGSHVRGSTAARVLASFPKDEEGRQARLLLQQAAGK